MKYQDIKDIFLELCDINYELTHYNRSSNNYKFSDEFFIYRNGNSGYSLDGKQIELFNLYDINEELLRFVKVCEINMIDYRIVVSDGEFTLDVKNKINNLSDVNQNDVLSKTHLHLKNKSGKRGYIDIENVKFCSCQILKDQ